MALMAVLEADLRALSSEARRRYPAVKDAAEHAILKLRTLSDPSQIADNEDILRIFLLACEVKQTKLSVIGLSCLHKLIAHDAVAPSALREILSTLKDHAEMNDESVQLKTLQTILIIFQSRLHPEDEENMAIALGICLRLLENSRCADSVHNTAAATFRQAVALIFDHILLSESLPSNKINSSRSVSRTTFVSDDVSRSISTNIPVDTETSFGSFAAQSKDKLSVAGSLGLRLFEDLVALAAGGAATWLRVNALQRIFALDILEFVLSNYTLLFRARPSYEQVLRHQVCSLLMTSLRSTGELEGEAGEPAFRRLVLRSVSHLVRLYTSTLGTECEVFLNILIKIINLDLLLWHRIMVLEVIRSFCVEARVLRLFFQTFDMQPGNTNIVAGMTKALAQVVIDLQFQDTNEESLAAVAGMFNSKAKGIEWSMDNDATNAAVVVASEAHAITLAIEGLLGIVFTVATLTDEAVECGELNSPRCENDQIKGPLGEHASVCLAMVNAVWKTILDALSLILSRSHGEAIVLELLKGYQAFTQACGVLHAVEPLNAFLESLCKFTLPHHNEPDKKSNSGVLSSPGSKRTEYSLDSKDSVILTPKNVQALRTLFNIAHRLDNVLGSSWILVLETLAALDRVIHLPHATTQEISSAVPRLARETSSHSSDFSILSSLNTQLFESSGSMNTSAVSALLGALRQLSYDTLFGVTTGVRQSASPNFNAIGNALSGQGQQTANKVFAIERMIAVLVNNLHRVEFFWDQVVTHFLELAEHGSHQVRNLALDAIDRSICAVLGCERLQQKASTWSLECSTDGKEESKPNISRAKTFDSCGTHGYPLASKPTDFEYVVLSPLRTLYYNNRNAEGRAGTLKILLHVLERHAEKLYHSWPSILDLLRTVVHTSEKELIFLGFQSVRVIMNDGLVAVPAQCHEICIEVVGDYGAQDVDINISLTAIGLLWTTSDFFGRGLQVELQSNEEAAALFATDEHPDTNGQSMNIDCEGRDISDVPSEKFQRTTPKILETDCERLLLLVFDVLQNLGTDGRPEVRNSAIRILFQSLSSHGHKLSYKIWEHCLWKVVFPLFSNVQHLAATSSKDEWQGKELGVKGGKPVHMLVHHSRNTAQKQWDETLVLVLGGIGRLLRSFFHIFLTMEKFREGWDQLLLFVQESILNGNKEVALAANNCLQTILLAHCAKGTMPLGYFESAFLVYETVLQNSSHYESGVSSKVKQEILRGLGELYLQGYDMINITLYLCILELVDSVARNPRNALDGPFIDTGSISSLQRTVLEVLALLKPKDQKLSKAWPSLFKKLLLYLPGTGANFSSENTEGGKSLAKENNKLEGTINGSCSDLDISSFNSHTIKDSINSGASISSASVIKDFHMSDNLSCPLFAEKAISVITDHFVGAPVTERLDASAEVVAGIGRCMLTRRDRPDDSLWRTAMKAFNCILANEIHNFQKDMHSSDSNTYSRSGNSRSRFWKEVADTYYSFLVGSCGRAFRAERLSTGRLKEDESLEITVLDFLCNKVLKSPIDAPVEVLQRLVSALDVCAARTSSLPIESVELLPAHCSSFSLNCLKKLFLLCSIVDDKDCSRITVGQIALPVLLDRCSFILCKFLSDENECGETPLPRARIEEVIFLLQELARLVLHSSLIPNLDLPVVLKKVLPDKERSHLIVLFPALCELVVCREARVRELVQVLLRLVGNELGLNKQHS